MNRKQFIILLVLGVFIGGAGLIFSTRDAGSSSAPQLGQKVLANLPINEVARITIRDQQGELNLVKSDDLWRVQERDLYPANFSQISEFLIKAADLKIVQADSVGPSQLPRLELVEPGKGDKTGTVVEFKDAGGKTIQSLLLGKKHMRKSEAQSPFGGGDWADGRYVLLPNREQNVALISDPLNNIEPKAESWVNKDFFKVEKPRSVELVSSTPENSWKIVRASETGSWSLADARDGEQLDTSKASGATNPFSWPSFDDVVSKNATPEEYGLDQPTVLKVETFDGLAYTFRIGKQTAQEKYPLTLAVSTTLPTERTPGENEEPEDKERLDQEFQERLRKAQEKLEKEKRFENWTYLVSKWTVDSVLKDRSQILAEPKEPVLDADDS
jgi:hypothetical protein